METERHPLNAAFTWHAASGPFRRITTERHWMTELGWRGLEDPKTAVPTPARAGSTVVFSSLTPHRIGRNLTGDVRKAYIVQFAPDDARTIRIDERTGARHEEPCDDPARQFPVLTAGRPA